MKKVLLTGASGFLGYYISQALMQNGHTLISVGRSPGNTVVCNVAAEIPVLSEPVDWVVHAMGKAHMVPATAEEEEDFFAVNEAGTKHVCAALEAMPKLPTHFVFISTVAVYGADEGHMINEQHPLNGTSPYAKSKIAAEAYLTRWCNQHHVLLTILRLPLVAGANPPGNLGAMITGIQPAGISI